MHAVVLVRGHEGAEAGVVAVADHLADRRRGQEDFGRGDARHVGVGRGHEHLADDDHQVGRQDLAHQAPVLRREHLQHPRDHRRGARGVDGGEDQAAGLGRTQDALAGVFVADLAHQDHVGVLAGQAPQRIGERRGVRADLPLVDEGRLVVEEELNGVFHREDVAAAGLVDAFQARRNARRLARAAHPREDHQPLAVLADLLERLLGQVQFLEGGDAAADTPGRQTHVPALAVDVDAEAVAGAGLVGKVGAAGVLEFLADARVHQAEDELEDLIGPERGQVRRLDGPRDPQQGRLARLQVNVRCLALQRQGEQVFRVHVPLVGAHSVFRYQERVPVATAAGRTATPACRRARLASSIENFR